MKAQHIAWLAVLGAVGAFIGLIGFEIAGLKTFADAAQPAFVGKTLGHLATVIAAFVGGKFLPQSGSAQE